MPAKGAWRTVANHRRRGQAQPLDVPPQGGEAVETHLLPAVREAERIAEARIHPELLGPRQRAALVGEVEVVGAGATQLGEAVEGVQPPALEGHVELVS